MPKKSQKMTLQPQLNRNKTLMMFEKSNKELLGDIREEVNYRMPSEYISWQVLSTFITNRALEEGTLESSGVR